jgi:hypothetical protein
MAELTTIGYFDLSGPIPDSEHFSQKLVRLGDVQTAIADWRSTFLNFLNFLDAQVSLPMTPGGLGALTADEMLLWVRFFAAFDEVEVEVPGLGTPGWPGHQRPHRHRTQNAHDATLWQDSILERLYDKRLVATKKRQRGRFRAGSALPGDAGMRMRIRIPHG